MSSGGAWNLITNTWGSIEWRLMWLHKIVDKYGYRLCVDLSKDVKRKKGNEKEKGKRMVWVFI
jgi:hypothetical protein